VRRLRTVQDRRRLERRCCRASCPRRRVSGPNMPVAQQAIATLTSQTAPKLSRIQSTFSPTPLAGNRTSRFPVLCVRALQTTCDAVGVSRKIRVPGVYCPAVRTVHGASRNEDDQRYFNFGALSLSLCSRLGFPGTSHQKSYLSPQRLRQPS
jgi:hypothetical protein